MWFQVGFKIGFWVRIRRFSWFQEGFRITSGGLEGGFQEMIQTVQGSGLTLWFFVSWIF